MSNKEKLVKGKDVKDEIEIVDAGVDESEDDEGPVDRTVQIAVVEEPDVDREI